MTDIIRQQSPPASSGTAGQYKPEELNADLAAASLAKDLVNKLPTPAIDTRKFTIIHGLMRSLNHNPPTFKDVLISSDIGLIKDCIAQEIVGKPGYMRIMVDPGNATYIDTSALINLMDQVSEKSVNVDGRYFSTIFAYLMKPKYVIQGMPQATVQEEEKPGFFSRLWGGITGRNKSQEAQKQ